MALHPSAVRRYFDDKEELLLAPADGHRGTVTLARPPLYRDLLTHVSLSLEGDVTIDRARRFETNSFAAFDTVAETLTATGTMTTEQTEDLLAAMVCLTAHLWQVSHPTPPPPLPNSSTRTPTGAAWPSTTSPTSPGSSRPRRSASPPSDATGRGSTLLWWITVRCRG
ncbi:hypothetical protein OHT52_07460 [Streptomyces sp. NBC_00247]|uniref:hypothetical protein n=1 Tax=Streptomyces sp. NBC_00247 TaxID=2975689 RepID=UPI002E2B85CA|nr:hypothetical protein [Streptomyces sp. NBC_00247]